jgi:alpha-tubulin suppressor-like RCC1 family protein
VLGDGGVAVGSAPIDVPGLTGVTELKAGRFHTCAVKNDGTLWCWGLNQTGQIGDGTVADRSRPTRVSGLADVVAVAPGANHTCAARSDGTVACWGSNNFGQLGKGIGQSTPTLVPAAVPQFTGALNLVAGAFHTCALRRVLFSLDPPASCWGDSSSGQLGAPSTTVFGPVSPSITDITSLAAGDGHSCAVKGDGTAVCWGLNNHGQLGDGTTVNKDRPTPVI